MGDNTGHDDTTAPIPGAAVIEPPPPTPAPSPEPSTAAGRSGRGQGVRLIRLQRDSDWFWPLAGLIAYLLMLFMNFLANWIPFNDQTTGEVITRHPIPFQPAGWAFYIWILIYGLLGAYVVYTLTPGGQRSHRVRRIGVVFVLSCAANIAWLLLWHWEQFLLSLIAILVLWVALLVIYVLARRGNVDGRLPSRWQKLVIQIPFSVYLGWVTVAALADFAVWANRSWHSGNPFSDRAWAVILLIAGVIIAAAFALFARDPIVPLVAVWAYVAIVQQQWTGPTLVVVVGVIGAIVTAALTVAAWSLRLNPEALSDFSPRRRRPGRTPGTSSG